MMSQSQFQSLNIFGHTQNNNNNNFGMTCKKKTKQWMGRRCNFTAGFICEITKIMIKLQKERGTDRSATVCLCSNGLESRHQLHCTNIWHDHILPQTVYVMFLQIFSVIFNMFFFGHKLT